MVSETIPDDVREFVQTHVDSIAQLEALLLLRRESSAPWDATTVAKRLYIPDHDAAEVLRELLVRGFLRSDGKTFQYRCPAEVDTLVGNVADVYARQLIPVTHLIHNKSSRIREFANAFKLRKEPK
jgi:hypothetical protein